MTVSTTIERIKEKAMSRGIRLSPPLTEAEIANFERFNGVGLPPDYREFLLCVGDGGAGPPEYGLCALGTTPSDFDFARPDLSRPFPFTRPWTWEDGASSSEGRQDDAYLGILILGTDGCGQYWVLVVRGPDFGKIWMLGDVGITPAIPNMTFVQWYETWLDGKPDWWG